MHCPKCGKPIGARQKKCTECGHEFRALAGSVALQVIADTVLEAGKMSASQKAAEGTAKVLRKAFGSHYPAWLFEGELGELEPALACSFVLLLAEFVAVPSSARVTKIARLGLAGAGKDMMDKFSVRATKLFGRIAELNLDPDEE